MKSCKALRCKELQVFFTKGKQDLISRYTGTIEQISELPNNSYILKLGSTMRVILGDSFTWELRDNTSYICVHKKITSREDRYELSTLGGPECWTGYLLNETQSEITWSYLPEKLNLKSSFDGLNMTNINVSSDNLVYEDANSLPDNSIIRFSSDLTESQVQNLPFYGSTTVILSMRYTKMDRTSTSDKFSACQIAWKSVPSDESPSLAFRTRYSQTTSSWTSWKTLSSFDDLIVLTGISIDSSNYTTYASTNYSDPNSISTSSIVRYASSLTNIMVPNLPEYGRSIVLMTIRYSPSNITASSGSFGRLQLAWSATSSTGDRRLWYRVSYSQTTSSWGIWHCLQQDDGLKPIYVAIGTSVTRGEIHRKNESTTISDYPYPQYIGQIHNMEVHNLAQGGTGVISRGGDGTKQNFMDVITSNESLIASANLITIEWGGNDSALIGGRMGNITDYFKYEEYVNNYASMVENATELGGLNWCINRIFELNQRVTLILICGSGYNKNLSINVDKTSGIITYTSPSENSWFVKQRIASEQLRKVTGIPTINCSDGYVMTVYNKTGNDSIGYYGHDQVHPTNEGYLMKARYLAGEIGKYFTHS